MADRWPGTSLTLASMCWKHCHALTQSHDFIALATLAGANLSALCRRFGVSRHVEVTRPV